MGLREYRKKRQFKKTPEPRGNHLHRVSNHHYVVQKHAASHLHYDFRLEVNGTLKSWAVPKGIPLSKGEKRLAIQVEDHPVDYADFEGTIPKGQYGGGTVMVWDRGTFEPVDGSPGESLAAGKFHFILSGVKLRGEWSLIRMRESKQWLLIRHAEDMRPISKAEDNRSAISAKTMKQLAAEGGQKDSPDPPAARRSRRLSTARSRPTKRTNSALLRFIQPMKARLVRSPPNGQWIYEVKLDGFRALALKQNQEVRLMSRNEKDLGERFQKVVEAVGKLPAHEAIIDGEIVALDADGRPSFQLLQAYELGERSPPIQYYAFDLLWLNGKDLREEILTTRKSCLERLLHGRNGVVRYSASLEGDVTDLLAHIRRLGLEGLIGKKKDSQYEAGRRTGAWIKLKVHDEQEFVIGGFTEPKGSRKYFGALLVGYYARDGLRSAGKVGTGFTQRSFGRLHAQFEPIARRSCPFVDLSGGNARSHGISRAELRKCRWLEPKLVCQVKFSEWTRDGQVRQPVFQGLREDRDPKEVVRETPS